MKIIYKLFLFAIILRLMPVVITSMGIFPNTALGGLGYDFNANDDPITILTQIVTGGNDASTGIGIPGSEFFNNGQRITVSLQFTLTSIMAAIALVAVLKAGALPAIAAAGTAVLVVPMMINIGYIFVRSAEAEYHSTTLTLMLISIIISLIALGIITLFDYVSGQHTTGDD